MKRVYKDNGDGTASITAYVWNGRAYQTLNPAAGENPRPTLAEVQARELPIIANTQTANNNIMNRNCQGDQKPNPVLGAKENVYGAKGAAFPAIPTTAMGKRSARTKLSIVMDATNATEDTQVILFDGNLLHELIAKKAFFDALKNSGGYAGINVSITGSYGVNTLTLLKQQTGNNPWHISNLHIESFLSGQKDSSYFSANDLSDSRATLKGQAHETQISWPDTRGDQFQDYVRDLYDYQRVIDGYNALIVPLPVGYKIQMSFFVTMNEQAYLMQDVYQ